MVAQVFRQREGFYLLELTVLQPIHQEFALGKQDDFIGTVAIEIAGVHVHEIDWNVPAAVAGDQFKAAAGLQTCGAAGHEVLPEGALRMRRLEGRRALALRGSCCRLLGTRLAEHGAADFPGDLIDGGHGAVHGRKRAAELSRRLSGVAGEDICGKFEKVALACQRTNDQKLSPGFLQLLAEGLVIACLQRRGHLLRGAPLGNRGDVGARGQPAGQHAGQAVLQVGVGAGNIDGKRQKNHLASGGFGFLGCGGERRCRKRGQRSRGQEQRQYGQRPEAGQD